MRQPVITALVQCLVAVPVMLTMARAEETFDLRQQVAEVARLQRAGFEATKRARNDALNALVREHVRHNGGQLTAALLQQFNVALAECELTGFDDFLAAETTPLRYVQDPATQRRVPIFGALGSDLINPWLANLQLVDGAPLEEQPIYRCAVNALQEHLDFALIGHCDPSLSLDCVPEELRANCRLYYRRLNPANRFAGGFDHPLFYATVRMAARKLFQEDHPQARISMAELVAPERLGGFGAGSCLLCHNRNHSDVYKRLLSQGLYHQAKAAELPSDSAERNAARHDADTYLRAADHVLAEYPDRIDADAVRRSLGLLAYDNLERLKPGYEAFVGTMNQIGCLKCHHPEADVPGEFNPADFGAFTLHPSAYYKTENIKTLLGLVDIKHLDDSLLLVKARSKATYADLEDGAPETVTHQGAANFRGREAEIVRLRDALDHWINSFRVASDKAPAADQAGR